jgi:hypothetical protein
MFVLCGVGAAFAWQRLQLAPKKALLSHLRAERWIRDESRIDLIKRRKFSNPNVTKKSLKCGVNPVSGSGCFLSECAADQREPGTQGTLTHTKDTQYLLYSQNTLGDAACATRWVNFGSKRWVKLDERM